MPSMPFRVTSGTQQADCEARGRHHRCRVRSQGFQIRAAENACDAPLKRQPCRRLVQRELDVALRKATRFVIGELKPQLARIPIVERQTRVVVLDDALQRFGDRLEERGVVEL